MIALLLAGWLAPALAVWLVLSVLVPRRTTAGGWLNLVLGVGIGTGLSACLLYLRLAVDGRVDRLFLAVESAMWLAGAAALWLIMRRRSVATPVPATPPRRLLAAAFTAVVFALVIAVGAAAASAPHGRWDAFAIWNLRARFLFRAGPHWTDAFAPELAWSHPDYPLLLPAVVARSWTVLGHDTPRVPMIFSLSFAIALVALLVSAISALRDRTLGLLAGLALLAADHFVRHAPDQYADIPLAFYMLAATTLACVGSQNGDRADGCFLLAGVAAGLAAWTKNEGLLFVVSLAIVLVARAMLSDRTRAGATRVLAFAAALAPILAIVAHFKWRYAPPNDIFGPMSWADLRDRLLDPARLAEVAWNFGRRIIVYSRGLPIVLAVVGFLLGPRRDGRFRAAVLPAAVAFLMLVGDCFVYVITPHDIGWHLSTSANRLILQVFPLLILAFFLAVRSPADQMPAVPSSAAPPSL